MEEIRLSFGIVGLIISIACSLYWFAFAIAKGIKKGLK
jgi:hypothetical protein